jgi:hypothetical protein
MARPMDRGASSTLVADPVRTEPTMREAAHAPSVMTGQGGLQGSTTGGEVEEQVLVSRISGRRDPSSETTSHERASRISSVGSDGEASRPLSTPASGLLVPAGSPTSGSNTVHPGPTGDAPSSRSASRPRPAGDSTPSTLAREPAGPPTPRRDSHGDDQDRANRESSTPVVRLDQAGLLEPSSRARDAGHEASPYLGVAVVGHTETEGTAPPPEAPERIDSAISGSQVTITIGRVDVRAPTTRPSPAPLPPRRPQPRVSLDDYLRQSRRR